jgi:hypothetical protein
MGTTPQAARLKPLAWSTITNDKLVLHLITHGISLHFNQEAPSFTIPNRPLSEEEAVWIRKEVDRLLLNRCISNTTTPPRCISPIFLVPKAGEEKFRLIFDLSTLNQYLFESPSVRYGGISKFQKIFHSGDVAVKLDLKAGYHHFQMAPSARPFLGFQFEGKFYVWNVLPFGLSLAPKIFTLLLSPVVNFLSRCGIRLVDYLDDFLILASPHHIHTHKQTVLTLFSALGLEINLKKSILEPSRVVEFLGLTLDLSAEIPKITVPAGKRRAILSDISRMLRDQSNGKPVQLIALARLHGQIVHLYQAFPLLRALSYNLSHQIAKAARRHLGWSAKNRVSLSVASIADLQALRAEMLSRRFEGRFLPVAVYPPTFVITTDASTWGWAASLQQIGNHLSTTSLSPPINMCIQDRWDHLDSHSHINVLETKAILFAIKAFRKHIHNQVISIRADSIVALAVLRRMASHLSPGLNTLGAAIARLFSRYRVVVSDLTYIPSQSNPMDSFSRQWSLARLSIEWPLRTNVFHYLCQFFNVIPVVDVFATCSNAKVPRFWSRFLDPRAEAVNAFDQSWNPTRVGGLLYINPPFAMLPRTIAKIIRDKAQALLIVPEWFSAEWWMQMTKCCAHPLYVRLHSSIVMEQNVQNPRWHLRALMVDGALYSC